MNLIDRILTLLLSNPVAAALHCMRKGHWWREENNCKGYRHTVCAWCGQYGGRRSTGDDRCHYSRRNAA